MSKNSRELRRLETRLHAGAQVDQILLAHRCLPALKKEEARLSAKLMAIAREWAELVGRFLGVAPPADSEPVVREEHRTRARSYWVLGWIAAAGEAVLGAGVSKGWLSGWTLIIIPVGIALALFLTWICKLLWSARLDELVPEVEYRRREKLVWIVALLVVALIAAFLVVRFFAVAGLVMLLTLGLLSVLLPLLAGGCFVLASVLDERNRLALQYEKLRVHLDRIEMLSARCESLLALEPELPAHPGDAPETGARSTGPVAASLCLIASLALLGATGAAADAGCSTSTRLNLWIDVSGSIDQDEARRVLDILLEALPESHCVTSVALYPFARARDVLRGPQSLLRGPMQPDFACTRELRDLTQHLKPVIARHEAACSSEREQLLEPHRRAREQFRRQVRSSLLNLDLAPVDVPQTCLLQVLSRVAADRSGALNLVVTDGAHFKCDGTPTELFGLNPDKPPNATVILLPSNGSPVDLFARVNERVRQLREHTPTVNVVPSFEIDSLESLLAVTPR